MAFGTFLGILLVSTRFFQSEASPILIEADARALDDPYRLPATVKPLEYDLSLILKEDVFVSNKFSGEVTIKLRVEKATSEIYLHRSKDVSLKSVVLKKILGENPSVTAIELSKIEYNATTEILRIPLVEAIAASEGQYSLVFTYDAALITSDMYGLYKSSYQEGNKTHYLATTQFQATYARRVLPSFDEPGFKATFAIKIQHPQQYKAVSNMPGVTSAPDAANLVTTTFEKTPKMSSYLVAFIISTFGCSKGDNIENDKIPYQVCSREGTQVTREYAVDIGPKLLQELGNFTGIAYSSAKIPKMDQFAIPDFAAGAMENWGLVTYRETALLWDPVESSNRYKQRVASVVAHEFAHQWFGNLVTCHWWSDAFLNEGFATYFEYFSTGNVETSWEMDKQFVVDVVQSMLASDAGDLAPLSSQVSSQSGISGRFGSVTYSKGGSILRMVDTIMGTDKFKQGLNRYLTARQFDTATPDQLWDNLQGSVPPESLPSGVNLKQVMDNWVNKNGYPIVTVTAKGEDVVISQQRFTSGSAQSNQTWYVPISYTTSKDTNGFNRTAPAVWLTPDGGDVTLKGVLKDANWIILNNQQRGYFRVAYDSALFSSISSALGKIGFDGIHELNRAQIIDDLLNRARYNQVQYSDLLENLQFLRHDTSYFSWYPFFVGFNLMYQRTGQQNVRDALYNYVLDLMKNLYNSVPFNKEIVDNQIYTHKQVLAITWACRLHVQDCIQNSISAFQNYKNTKVKPSKNLRPIIYCTALRDSVQPEVDWNFLWEEFGKTDVSTEEVTIISALGCTKDVKLLNDYLTKSITSGSGIRPQDALSVFSAVYTGNPEGVDVALDFLITNHAAITNYYSSMNSLSNLVGGISGRLTKDEQIAKLEKFSQDESIAESLRNYAKNGVNSARNNMNWTKSFEGQLSDYFLKTPSSAGTVSGYGVAATLLVTIIVQFLRV